MRARLAGLLGAAIIVASCGGPGTSPSASTLPGTPEASASFLPTVAPTPGGGSSLPTASPTATGPPTSSPIGTPSSTSEPVAAGRWERTGSMALGRGLPHAALLGDGTVLVVGNDVDGGDCVRADSRLSETWDPASGSWTAGPSLNAPRAAFAAVPMAGGGVLVTGGVTAGTEVYGSQERHQSYSSTYVLDPTREPAAWSRAGLLVRARTLPTAATLRDGRILVAGGYYLSGKEEGRAGPAVALAAFRDRGGEAPDRDRGPLGDLAPPTTVLAFASAELYDPATGAWSTTGSMKYARVAPPSVTLADGRVLVVGSSPTPWGWNFTQAVVADRAYVTAEVYDPRAGRFSLTGGLPSVDWSLLQRWGPYPVSTSGVEDPGTLVALDDGGALLVGQVTSWSILALELDGTIVRTLRFDPAAGRWAVIDQRVVAYTYSDQPVPTEVIVAGHSREGALAVALDDGRILVAGGHDDRVAQEGALQGLLDTAELFDPATGTWFQVQPMPEARSGGAAVLLADGSVLVVGGFPATGTCEDPEGGCDPCGQGLTLEDTGSSSAVRFFPGP